jgi:hypothetical protein
MLFKRVLLACLIIPSTLVLSAGILVKENHATEADYKQALLLVFVAL